MTERLLTAQDVAERWQVTPSMVYRLAREGKIPAVRLGRHVRFRLDAIMAFEYSDAWQENEAPPVPKRDFPQY